MIGVFVDELLVTGIAKSAVDEFFVEMSLLSIADLGVVNNFLRLRIEPDNKKLTHFGSRGSYRSTTEGVQTGISGTVYK